ncbi:ABC transporter ATP-binding protein [Clostridium botulinum]|uniref:ABC-type quaternary amine transporter n=1 Tax=Clostridium botulinum (strain Okra / Type B1) TaxID=498213 RepID=B1IIV3_CLOBK|nr:ABC transporter ATP-binding protein [Clostridium botulinum]ACA43770.1 ABC transporter, ATP-binding protein [Clostridium botulinum B1 str. Okra]MBD5562786.1 ABC transporter ATP-binding protein [Clostridium botulinum]MBD5565664.1 ABC transporter ATP-binding protein [Clostridium botulinum]MBD5569819.1 ABC transporter ATP-binding protein [Clostridium botulinum]MBD5573385.1 ABC transporter ATP-binding protein [Clostridium botulinum]
MYLKINNLVKVFNNIKVVDNINLELEKGKLLCLLGPSGCGKTTTLKIIGGFLKQDKGNILIENEDISKIPPENRAVSTVFQSYALFPHMNVIENIIYGLKFKGYRKKEALKKGEEYLEIIGLSEFKDKKISKLSGGQQQRVALARALIVNPKILLLDEPLSNLDAKLRIKMRKEIKEIQSKFNMTMIFVTHDQEEALSIADYLAVMNKGELIQVGTPEEIYINPKNEFVASFIGHINKVNINNKTELIRPEQITINKSQGDKKGRIKYKQFLGSYVNYFIETKDETIIVQGSNSKNGVFKEGENIYINFLN